MLHKTEDFIAVDKGEGVQKQRVYERRVVTKVLVSKVSLEKRKRELEEELTQVNLDLAQIAEDEKNGMP